ncbi:DUF6188 family protein [Rhodococcus sp. G-MC3]|uniref:DUF6188 family protein n=1 Tax=Rhodococcus sp. G-MC3 TaxID=3046209 RepID=UPI0024BAA8CE|nr:DUF6188 family protein [Rhodococcus sp. G-MC3]MDJ0393649.1 DUF6188 family protein [Rhodococcus sp. G-MC3]
MQLNLHTRTVVSIHLDFDVSLEFDDGSMVAFSEFAVDENMYDEDNQFEGLRKLVGLLGTACTMSAVSDSGALVLEFDSGTRVSAVPRTEVESWEFTAADGALMVCLPGGEIDGSAAPANYSPPSHRPPSPRGNAIPEGSTVVRLSVGRDGGVEFSNGSFLPIEVPLHDAYLILRESVVSVRNAEGAMQVKLSSGIHLISR